VAWSVTAKIADPAAVEAGDPPDGLAIAVSPPDGTIVIHRKHVLDPP
jgi:hypothetical protein